MLKARLYAGTTMVVVSVAVLVGDLFFAPYYPFLAVAIGMAAALSAHELCELLNRQGAQLRRRLGVLGTLVVIGSNWLPAACGTQPGSLESLAYPFVAFLFVMMAMFMLAAYEFSSDSQATRKVGGYLFVFFYVGCLGSFIVQTRWLGSTPAAGAVAFFLSAFSAKVCDIGAYFTGRAFGRHKLAPELSPGKTWEGLAGGVLVSMLMALTVAAASPYLLGEQFLTLTMAAAFAVVVAVTGQIGDLMESLIKRDSAQKDASDRIPGFGGILDVVDSVLFSGPVAYALLRLAGL